MKIELHKITVRELTEGYVDNQEAGVKAYGGKLDVRPPFQREFVYNDKERDAVIDTIVNNFPLNVMYWSVREPWNADVPVHNDVQDEDEDVRTPRYEIIDGQQRTISICQYVNGDFAHLFRYFDNLTKEEKDQILNYELYIYRCTGTDKEKLKWFKTINIAGKKLTNQELLNAVYASPWLSDAKRYFSKSNCGAYLMGNKYLTGSPIQQDYLETVLRWAADANKTASGTLAPLSIEQYMAEHSIKDSDATALWLYFQQVINWVQAKFKYRSVMKGVDWGAIYNKYGEEHINIEEMEQRISALIQDSDVGNQKGIYWYVFDADERHLQIRAFDGNTKRRQYEKQQGICPICGKHFELEQMEADHITPWSQGGHTTPDNCQMLCRDCNRRKSSK